MSLPFENVDTTFESFLQELPEDFRELAIEFKAFARSRKIKTPEQLMQVVMNYCGLDAVLRETAGNFTLLEERISDTAIHNRLKACVPWVKALLTGMMGEAVKPLLEGRLRILVADGVDGAKPRCDRYPVSGVSRSWGRASLAARQGVVDCLETRPRRGRALVTLKRYPMGL